MIDLALQSVVFHTSPSALVRTARAVGEAVARVRADRDDMHVIEWRIADCSVPAILDDPLLARLAAEAAQGAGNTIVVVVRAVVLHENLGPSAGHNRLWAANGDARLLMLMAPDLVLAPDALTLLAASLDDPAVGAAAARRIPIEMVPPFDRESGEAERVGGARSMVRGVAWEAVGGHDEAFFLYGNDAHLSAQLRAHGWRLEYQPAAVVHHDNRPEADGREPRSAVARHFAALGHLILLRTWSAVGALHRLELRLARARDPERVRALQRFRELVDEGLLPAPRSHPVITDDLERGDLEQGDRLLGDRAPDGRAPRGGGS